MKFSKCYTVFNEDKVIESYKKREKSIIANISDGNLEEVIRLFIDYIKEPCFFFIEVPLNEMDEKKLRKKDTDPFHQVEYFIDNIDKATCFSILNKHGEGLINDGLISFGFASHSTNDEIYIQKYNVVHFYSDSNLNDIENILNNKGIYETTTFITAWDTFTDSHPGKSVRCDNFDTNEFIKEYEELGIYPSRIVDDR